MIPIGAVLCGCLVAAAILLWPRSPTLPEAHRRTSRASIRLRRAEPGATGTQVPATPDRVADALLLLSLALRAGFDPIAALERTATHVEGVVGQHLRTVAAAHRWGRDPGECWRLVPAVWQPAAVAWQAALRAGISPGPLLARSAGVIRDREAQRREAALAKAGVLLVLPLGLAFLPGFVATTVVPVVLRLVAGFLDGGLLP